MYQYIYKNTTRIGVTIGALSLLGGCKMVKSGQEFQARPAVMQHQISSYVPNLTQMSPANFIAPSSNAWWQVFQDPQLDRLVANAVSNGFDVRRALVEVERAEAIVRGAIAGAGPTASLSSDLKLNATDLGTSAQSNASNLGLSSTWNADLFGGLRSTIKAGNANIHANRALHRDAQRLVIARTVQSYLAYHHAGERRQLASDNIVRLRQNTRKIARLVEGGYNTKLDLSRSENQIYELQANVSAFKIRQTMAINALAALTNQAPARLIQSLSRPASAGITLPDKIPMPNIQALTRNRPDLRRAQWNLVATTHGVDAARAALYPNLTLSAQSFLSGRNAGHWPQLSSLSGALIGSIAAPLLGRGRILAGVDQRRADVKRAVIEYESAVLNSVLEIDTGLSKWRHHRERLGYRRAGLDSARQAQGLAERLFYAGESDFTASILAEQTRLKAEDNYLVAKNDVLTTYVDYVSAIIPGW